MPLIRPEVQKILREAGLVKDPAAALSLEDQLSEAGLSSETLAENLVGLALRSGNDGIRLRALETALKVKGALKETATALPNFTVVIQNYSHQELSKTSGANPIIFPRQSLVLNEGQGIVDQSESEVDEEEAEED